MSYRAAGCQRFPLPTIGADEIEIRNFSRLRRFRLRNRPCLGLIDSRGGLMNGLIYLVGLIVVIMAVLSLFGLR
jgi:hypothetical protein